MENINMPERIESTCLFLEKHSLEMAKTVFDAVDRERARLGLFLPWVEFTKELKDAESHVEQVLKDWENEKGFGFNIISSTEAKLIGKIGIVALSLKDRRCEIGYWITSEYEGKGFMSEAVTALESTCFSLGFNRIEIRCSSENERSASLPKRLGYKLDGTLREDAVENGRYRNTLVFSKLKSDK